MGVLKIPKYDLKKFINVFNRRFGLFIIFVFVLFFDSIYFVENILDSQIPINILMIFGFIVMIIFGYFFVKTFGYIGMALSFLLSNIAYSIILLFFYIVKIVKN